MNKTLITLTTLSLLAAPAVFAKGGGHGSMQQLRTQTKTMQHAGNQFRHTNQYRYTYQHKNGTVSALRSATKTQKRGE
jgi:hypothetical protein